MEKRDLTISNKTVAYNGAVAAVAATFAYSIIVMIYAILRSSVSIYSIMPKGERITIVITSSFSVAYSVAIFSLIMATLSTAGGSVAALILKKSLQYFNPRFNFKKAILISCFTAIALLVLSYILFYSLLKDWMTFEYPETLMFWFLFPAAIFLAVGTIGGSKLNRALCTGY